MWRRGSTASGSCRSCESTVLAPGASGRARRGKMRAAPCAPEDSSPGAAPARPRSFRERPSEKALVADSNRKASVRFLQVIAVPRHSATALGRPLRRAAVGGPGRARLAGRGGRRRMRASLRRPGARRRAGGRSGRQRRYRGDELCALGRKEGVRGSRSAAPPSIGRASPCRGHCSRKPRAVIRSRSIERSPQHSAAGEGRIVLRALGRAAARRAPGMFVESADRRERHGRQAAESERPGEQGDEPGGRETGGGDGDASQNRRPAASVGDEYRPFVGQDLVCTAIHQLS